MRLTELASDLESLRAQQLAFQLQIASIAAKTSARGDDSMARRGRIAGLAHDGADRPPGAG